MSVPTKAWAVLNTRTGKFAKLGKLWTRLSSLKAHLPYYKVWNSANNGYSDQWVYPSTMDEDIIIEYEVIERRRMSLKDFMDGTYPLDRDTLVEALREMEQVTTKQPVCIVVATTDVQQVLDLLAAPALNVPDDPFLRGKYRGYPIYEDVYGEAGFVRVEKGRKHRKLRIPND